MYSNNFDIIIIGAGAAGLMAAKELSLSGKKIAVLEARDRTGGRIDTIAASGFAQPVDRGAEFVHGDLPLTKKLLKEAGAKLVAVSGSIWQHRDGSFQQKEDFIEQYEVLTQKCAQVKQDMPVAEFINTHLQGAEFESMCSSLKNYVEGYYAASLQKASTQAFCKEATGEDEDQYFIKGGYAKLAQHLEETCKKAGAAFFLLQPVWQLHWQKGRIEAITDKQTFTAQKALITVPIGVLQSGGITFFPALPHKTAAARALGFGHVVKIILSFSEAFWKQKTRTGAKDLRHLGFLFSEAQISTWWTQHPQATNTLTGWLAGPKALFYNSHNKEELIQTALQSLSQVFKIGMPELQQALQGAETHNWSADPFTNGAYSFQVVGGAAHMQTILQPEEDTLYFAGEGLHNGPEIGTVEAALFSGQAAARKMRL